MGYLSVFFFVVSTFYFVKCQTCEIECPTEDTQMVCGYDVKGVKYKMFPNNCTKNAYSDCYGVVYVETPLVFCINDHKSVSRRIYGESCPVFCPSHYRPVCGASKYRSYSYRAFNNGCYLDMLNCRGEDDMFGYIEVPLSFCQRHDMKNIFAEQIVVSPIHTNQDYF